MSAGDAHVVCPAKESASPPSTSGTRMSAKANDACNHHTVWVSAGLPPSMAMSTRYHAPMCSGGNGIGAPLM